MLRHPAYAGAYVYGRRQHDGRLRLPGKPHSGRRFLRDPRKWMVLQEGAFPAYIDWGAFERNQEQMAANRTRYTGIPRGGAALLGGLVAFGVCGRRMFTTYNDDGREAPRLSSNGDHLQRPRCCRSARGRSTGASAP